jgi:8-amino-7-oxononanoate synthase
MATVHTAGKSLGVGGAWIASSLQVREALIQWARPFLFSTAPSPLLAWALREALLHWQEVGPSRAARVLSHARQLSQLLLNSPARDFLFRPAPGVLPAGPILPLIVGKNAQALQASQILIGHGYDVRAIRPPTVPENTARLRVVLHSAALDHPTFDLERFAQTLAQVLLDATKHELPAELLNDLS